MTGRYSLTRRAVGPLLLNGLYILIAASLADARNLDIPPPADPYAAPQIDPYNPLKYITTNAYSAVGVGEHVEAQTSFDPEEIVVSRFSLPKRA